jgi:hypothetical protein
VCVVVEVSNERKESRSILNEMLSLIKPLKKRVRPPVHVRSESEAEIALVKRLRAHLRVCNGSPPYLVPEEVGVPTAVVAAAAAAAAVPSLRST